MKESKNLRVMTYNVHGCKGTDGFLSIERIARVIADYDPDIVALQELDVGRKRSAGVDQAKRIAEQLKMTFHFHPAFHYKKGQYGNAILSRSPMKLIKSGSLPSVWIESRGVMWLTGEYEGLKFNIMNTHLSIWPGERMLQVKALMSPKWLQNPDLTGSVILCGDFNMAPGSPGYQEVSKQIQDSQMLLDGHRPQRTWAFAGHPFRRIDHIFVTSEWKIHSVQALKKSDCLASDHLPLTVEMSLS